MAQAENIDARRVIKRAWEDGNFRALLLRDPRGALGELNIDVPGHLSLAVYDNTGSTHHMVICTPCSCYPSFYRHGAPLLERPELQDRHHQ